MNQPSLPIRCLAIAAVFLVATGNSRGFDVFTNPDIPAGESAGMQVLYELDVPATNPAYRNAVPVPYSVDLSASVTPGYTRIGYYMEVTSGTQAGEWVYISMDTFDPDPATLGLPHNVDNPVTRQTIVTNANIYSNNANIIAAIGSGTVNLEMWPSNYGQGDSAAIPNGTGRFDWSDTGFNTGAGHGSFQIHNHDAANPQTLFGWSDWGGNGVGNPSEFGIGNATLLGNPHEDWTFSDDGQAGFLQIVVGVEGELPPVALVAAAHGESTTQVSVFFNRPLDPITAEDPFNYTLSGGLNVLGAVLSANPRVVILTTDEQTQGETYTVTVNGVQDLEMPTPNTVATDSMAEFTPPLPPEPRAPELVSAAELAGMQMLYAVNDDQFDFNDAYIIDNSADHPIDSFPRVAYFIELGPAGDTRWVWASMDTFNPDPLLVGVPRAGTDIVEAGTLVSYLNIESNHPNLADVVGTGKDGIIEFWASNYNADGGGEYGSDDARFDWKDSGGTTGNGHGSFQVFAFNDVTLTSATTVFGITANGGSGIGDQYGPGGGNAPDWTFGPGTGTYQVRNVEVWVGVGNKPELPPLALVSAASGQSDDQIIVTFNRPIDQASAETASNYTLSNGLTVLSAVLAANGRGVILTTSPQTPGTAYNLTVNGVQDLAMPTPNTVATDSMAEFTVPPLPGAVGVVSAAELAGMQLLYAVDDGQWDFNDAYTIDNSADHPTDSFPRVAYFVELGPVGDTQWAWASMDTFNSDPLLVGVPRAGTNIVENGTLVTNLSVESNHPNLDGVVGTGKDGIIEFWASNYNANGAGQFGSDDALFDWKDGGAQTTANGHGSFQVFAFTDATMTAANTVFGITANGGAGIGDQPANGPNGNSPDWTFGPGTGTYAVRNLEVWVGSGIPAAPFEIVAFALNAAGDEATITFNSIPNATYAADYSFDLNEWTEINDNISSQGLSTTFPTPTAIGAVERQRVFYRIRRTTGA